MPAVPDVAQDGVVGEGEHVEEGQIEFGQTGDEMPVESGRVGSLVDAAETVAG